jgi:DNA-damage-inducible protein J
MSQSAIIHARIDPSTKEATEAVLQSIGMSPTEAIRLFYRQIAMRKEFPLELLTPNELTMHTLDKSAKNEDVEYFDSQEDLYDSWTK